MKADEDKSSEDKADKKDIVVEALTALKTVSSV